MTLLRSRQSSMHIETQAIHLTLNSDFAAMEVFVKYRELPQNNINANYLLVQ